MRLAWAIALGILAGCGLAWWVAREPAPPAPGSTEEDIRPASDNASSAPAPVLYRWRDDDGVLQLTQSRPAGHDYETVDVRALDRATVSGDP